MIDLNRTLVILHTHSNYLVDFRVIQYYLGKGMPFPNLLVTGLNKPIVIGRNMVIEQIVLPRIEQYDWFVFHDQDISPGKLTDPFLDDVPYDVVGAKYKSGNEGSWIVPEKIHMGAVRVRGSVFQQLPRPWFKFEYNEHHTSVLSCECGYFGSKALEQGFKITTRGIVDHNTDSREKSWHHSA